jgi:hypothetical protein
MVSMMPSKLRTNLLSSLLRSVRLAISPMIGMAASNCTVALRYELMLFAFSPQIPLLSFWKEGGYYAFPAKRMLSVC